MTQPDSNDPIPWVVLVQHTSGIEQNIYVTATTAAQAELDAVVAAAKTPAFFGTTNNTDEYMSMSVTQVQ